MITSTATTDHGWPGAFRSGGGAEWYVVTAKRHREMVAQRFLAERGVSSYLPRTVVWPRPAIGSEITPLFPGYLFVHAALPAQFARIAWTPGVKSFVAFGGATAVVEPEVIDYLRGREGPDRLIHCDRRLAPGREVEIVNGPFRGLTAVVEQCLLERERIRVLMHLLRRDTAVELPERWVRQA